MLSSLIFAFLMVHAADAPRLSSAPVVLDAQTADSMVREALGERRLKSDATLADAARCFGLAVAQGETLTIPLLRHCSRQAGVYDNLLLPVVAMRKDARLLVEDLAKFLASEGQARGITHYGAAAIPHEGWIYLSTLTTLRRAELVVEPHPVLPGERLMFHGSMTSAHHSARAFLSTPAGPVQVLQLQTLSSDRRVFHGSLVVPDVPGRYQLEIVGDTESGPIVVANRSLYVGDVAPTKPLDALQPAYGRTDAERIWSLVNMARAKAGIGPVVFDPDLCRVAQAHAHHMRDRHYFGHDTRSGAKPFRHRSAETMVMRLKDAGIVFSDAAENIAESATLADAHESLMSSPGHRATIVDARFKKIGVGIAQANLSTGDRSVYVVVDFTQP
jgi:uncharacterized protein YkwD